MKSTIKLPGIISLLTAILLSLFILNSCKGPLSTTTDEKDPNGKKQCAEWCVEKQNTCEDGCIEPSCDDDCKAINKKHFSGEGKCFFLPDAHDCTDACKDKIENQPTCPDPDACVQKHLDEIAKMFAEFQEKCKEDECDIPSHAAHIVYSARSGDTFVDEWMKRGGAVHPLDKLIPSNYNLNRRGEAYMCIDDADRINAKNRMNEQLDKDHGKEPNKYVRVQSDNVNKCEPEGCAIATNEMLKPVTDLVNRECGPGCDPLHKRFAIEAYTKNMRQSWVDRHGKTHDNLGGGKNVLDSIDITYIPSASFSPNLNMHPCFNACDRNKEGDLEAAKRELDAFHGYRYASGF